MYVLAEKVRGWHFGLSDRLLEFICDTLVQSQERAELFVLALMIVTYIKFCSPVKELVSLYRPLAQVEKMCQSGSLRPSRPRDPSSPSQAVGLWRSGRASGQDLGRRFQD